MSNLSSRTLGVLVDACREPFTRSDLTTMLMRAGLWDYGTGSGDSNKQELVRSRLLAARSASEQGDAEAQNSLFQFLIVIVERLVKYPQNAPEWFADLCENLLIDGYQLRWDDIEFNYGEMLPVFKIVPTDPTPVPLGEETTALEADLIGRNYLISLNHYRQAVSNFVQGNHEAANGQLRAAIEGLIVQLASENGYVGRGKAGEGGQAISYLIDNGLLKEEDGGVFLRGLWKMIHTSGAHPGQSDVDEARFRMATITAAMRFLLNHFPVKP